MLNYLKGGKSIQGYKDTVPFEKFQKTSEILFFLSIKRLNVSYCKHIANILVFFLHPQFNITKTTFITNTKLIALLTLPGTRPTS